MLTIAAPSSRTTCVSGLSSAFVFEDRFCKLCKRSDLVPDLKFPKEDIEGGWFGFHI